MPELPEVETIVRTLAPQITGKRIAAVTVLHAKSLQAGGEFLPLLRGARIIRVFRRAKLLLLALEPEHNLEMNPEIILAFHLKMTGRFFVHPAGTAPLKHTRIIFDLVDSGAEVPPAGSPTSLGARLFFDDMRTFGYCRVLLPQDLPEWPFWAALGPEPLESTPQELARMFAARFASKRSAVKGVLLDQTVIAGIGNIYADEALFSAGITPTAKAADISPKRLLRLAEALQAILRLSIEECGSSIRDYRDALGNAGAFQNSFAVYGRKGENCSTCGTPLTSTRVAGRGTVFCAMCQQP